MADNFDPREVCVALKLGRAATSKTQAQVANAVGLHKTYLSQIETGLHVPNPRTARRILEVLKSDAPKSPLAQRVLDEAEKIVDDHSDGDWKFI